MRSLACSFREIFSKGADGYRKRIIQRIVTAVVLMICGESGVALSSHRPPQKMTLLSHQHWGRIR